MRRRVATILTVLTVGTAAILSPTTASSASPRPDDLTSHPAREPSRADNPTVRPDGAASRPNGAQSPHQVRGVSTIAQAEAVAATGAYVDYHEHGILYVDATTEQALAIGRLGFGVEPIRPIDRGPAGVTGFGTLDFPAADAAYHNYAEMVAEVDRIAAAFPTLARKQTLGTTYQGRNIVALKISDNVAVDEDEPEILIVANQHAREHLTAEMALYLADQLTSRHGTEAEVTAAVNGREWWIVPMVNPDGVEYDIASGSYRMWRKNRQLDAALAPQYTDLNRNWAYKYGCCGGSSTNRSDDDYRGPSAFSAPETRAVSDFVLSRRVGGVQQIKVAIDFHTFSELVLWPFGYTTSTVTAGMSADEYDVFKTLGTAIARTNGYWPGQSSEMYPTDGDITDWLWGDQRIIAYTLEMYPKESDRHQFYPPASLITAETTRNKAAVLLLSQFADCPARIIGKEGSYCPRPDDFQVAAAPAAGSVAKGAAFTSTISNTTATGTAQSVVLSASGLPPGASASFSAASVPAGGSATVTISTTADTTPGSYPVVVTATGSAGTVRTTRVTLTVTGPAACQGTNGTDVPTVNNAARTSTITIAGCAGNGHSASRVDVKVVHPYIGDLTLTLISPSGVRRVLQQRAGANFRNIERSYPVDLSAEPANGAWRLEIRDSASGNSGYLDTWSLIL